MTMRNAQGLRQRGAGTECHRHGDRCNSGDAAEGVLKRHIVSFR